MRPPDIMGYFKFKLIWGWHCSKMRATHRDCLVPVFMVHQALPVAGP
jgi:hypothetical protein